MFRMFAVGAYVLTGCQLPQRSEYVCCVSDASSCVHVSDVLVSAFALRMVSRALHLCRHCQCSG
jgi:hypothetical protein